MSDKPMKTKDEEDVPTATEISLSDYALGSTASRAAARALLVRKTRTMRDRDAISIYRHCQDCEPELRAMVESTALYERGKELYEVGSSSPRQLLDHTHESSSASSAFRLAFGRAPVRGDVLRYDDVETIYRVYLALIEQFIEAWGRHFSAWPCPLRVESERVLVRRGSEWVAKEGGLSLPTERWCLIEAETYDDVITIDQPGSGRKARVTAVVFAGVRNGKPRWDPASGSERYRERPEATGGILGILARAAVRLGLQ